VNTDTPTTNRFEDRLLTAILDDFDNLTATPEPAALRLAGSPQPARITPRRVVPALAATAAAAGIAIAGVSVVGSGGPSHQASTTQTASGSHNATEHGTQPQLVAYQLASASAAASTTQGRYVILTETDTETDESGQSQRTTVIDTQTGASTTYQQPYADSNAPAVLTEGPDPTDTAAWYAALPTDPVALQTQLLALAMQQAADTAASMEAQAAKSGRTLPPNAGQQSLSDNDYVYQEADTLLWSPLVRPDLRSALYKVIAATGGYTVNTNTTDPAGRPAIAMTHIYAGTPETDITYENPTTGTVLAQVWKGASGTITAVYQPVTSTDTAPPNPYSN
jgi:hypothetical protein